MIIKSMARKAPSFGQLIQYFDKGQRRGETGVFSRNLYASTHDRDAIEREFQENHEYLPKRANGNALYHEIIVLDQDAKLSSKEGNRILIDLADRYCQSRAPGQLVYGRIHDDKDHRHIHLMISANAIKSPKRVRLPKKNFSEIQKNLETYLLERYPQVKAARIYTRSQKLEKTRITNREGEMERRTGKPSKKRQLRIALERCFSEAASKSDLEKRLLRENLRLYQRGQQIGVEPLNEGRRFRLKTLGLESLYLQMNERWKEAHEREKSLLNLREKDQAPVQSPISKAERIPSKNSENGDEVRSGRAAELLRRRANQEHFAEEHLKDFDGER